MITWLAPAFAACLVMTGILCYFGMHVIMREVIFVDLALAQIAALGAAVAAWAGFGPHSPAAYACSLLFTLIGAAVFAAGRFRDARVPQEAIIGIVYAVSTAAALLILSRIAVEKDEIDHMLVGRLLFVDWPELAASAAVFGLVGAVHWVLRARFLAASSSSAAAPAVTWTLRAWDFLFYATLGLVVTSAVQMAGVLPVFSLLVVPASCGITLFRTLRSRLVAGWALGLAGCCAGLAASAIWDLPTGESIVAAFGALFVLAAAAHRLRQHPCRRAP